MLTQGFIIQPKGKYKISLRNIKYFVEKFLKIMKIINPYANFYNNY